MVSENALLFKQVLVPVDGSPTSRKAVQYATHIAKSDGASLILLHVLEGLKQGGAIGLRAKFGDLRPFAALQKEMKKSAEAWMSELVKVAALQGVDAKSQVVGDVETHEVDMITDYARKNDMDLIVMGSRGQSKFRKLLIGSVANGVISHSPCPVLVVR
jgi:nucleotide-binding universal stress UspA family protein